MAEMTVPSGRSAYPVSLDVSPQVDNRNRLTTLFRIILAIPHIILVGGAFSIGTGWFIGLGRINDGANWGFWGGNGIIGFVAGVIAIIAWFAIVFTGKHPRALWDFTRFYLRWRVNALAYIALLRDEYPPFGDSSDYPVSFAVDYPGQGRDRLSVFFRIIYAIPHFIVLFFLGLAWTAVTIVAWFAILITGSYPRGLYDFAAGVFRWSTRVEAYVLLMRDEYPPFSLEA